MFDAEEKEILLEAATINESLSRRIRSSKTNPEDLQVISNALKDVAETLETVRRTVYIRIKV